MLLLSSKLMKTVPQNDKYQWKCRNNLMMKMSIDESTHLITYGQYY